MGLCHSTKCPEEQWSGTHVSWCLLRTTEAICLIDERQHQLDFSHHCTQPVPLNLTLHQFRSFLLLYFLQHTTHIIGYFFPRKKSLQKGDTGSPHPSALFTKYTQILEWRQSHSCLPFQKWGIIHTAFLSLSLQELYILPEYVETPFGQD